MKSLLTLLAVFAFALFATNTVLAADETPSDPVPEEAVKDPKVVEETPDLEKENAELKEKVKKLEAEVAKLTPKPKPVPPPMHWEFNFKLDFSYYTGNVEQTVMNDSMSLKYDSLTNWDLLFATVHNLVMADDEITEQYGYFTTTFTYQHNPWLANYAFTKHGWQESQKITYYGNVGAGAIWTFLMDPRDAKEYAKTPHYMHKLLAAVLVEHSDYAASANTESGEYVRVQIGVDLTQWLASDLVVGFIGNYTPNVEDFDDYVVDGLFWLEWIYDEYTTFNASVQYIETSAVPAGVEKVDIVVTVGVKIKFGW